MWKIVRNSTVTFSGKILSHVRKIWVDNLKVKIDVRIIKAALEGKRKIKGTSETKSLRNKVKEALRIANKVLGERSNWYRKWKESIGP